MIMTRIRTIEVKLVLAKNRFLQAMNIIYLIVGVRTDSLIL